MFSRDYKLVHRSLKITGVDGSVLFTVTLGCVTLKGRGWAAGKKAPCSHGTGCCPLGQGETGVPHPPTFPEQLNFSAPKRFWSAVWGSQRGEVTHTHRVSEKPAVKANSDFTVTSLRGDKILPHTFPRDMQDTLQRSLPRIRPWRSTGNNSKPEDTSCKDTECREEESHTNIFFSVFLCRWGFFSYLVEAHGSSFCSNIANFCSSMPFSYPRGELSNRKNGSQSHIKFWMHWSPAPTFPPLLCCVFVSC